MGTGTSPIETERTEADRAVVAAFERAIAQEAHNLASWPELTWQQLYNRLQWEGEAVLALLDAETRRRSSSGQTPWTRTRTQFRESPNLLVTLIGHEGAVHDCAVAADGSFAVSGGDDGTLRMWDPAAGREIRTLQGAGREFELSDDFAPIHACCVAPDGSYVVSAGWGLTLWNPSTGARIGDLGTDVGLVHTCAVSPDGSFVVSGGSEGLELWHPSSGQLLWRRATGAVNACAMAPDGSFVVSAGWDLLLWDPFTGEELRRWGTGEINCVAVSPDASFVVASGSGAYIGALIVVDPSSGEVMRSFLDTEGRVHSMAVAPDGSCVVTAGHDNALRLWDPMNGGDHSLKFQPLQPFRVLEGHTGSVHAVTFAADGSLLISASEDSTLKVWDPFPEGSENES